MSKSFVGCQYKLVYLLSRVNHPSLQKGNLPTYMSYRRDLAREAKVARQKDVLQQAEHIADQEQAHAQRVLEAF